MQKTLTATVLLSLLGGLFGNFAMAQAGDQAFEDLDVISLPGQKSKKPPLRLNWDCDVLLPSTSARYRPGACGKTPDQDEAREIRVENVELESADNTPRARRKLHY